MNHTTEFDALFIAATAKYLPTQVRWQWLKAEAIAESNLNPNVTASDGGMGLPQFMPQTWAQVCAEMRGAEFDKVVSDSDIREAIRNGDLPSPYNPDDAIPAMAFYFRSLWDQWTSPRPWFDRLQLTQASYNAGFGNVLRAQRLAHGATDYESIVAHLPQITGIANARITTNYVRHIHDYYVELTSGGTGTQV